MSAELAIYTILKDDSTVAAIVGTRIYGSTAPQKVTTPYIVYRRISGVRWRTMAGASGKAQPRMQVDLYDTGYNDVKTLANAARVALDDYKGMVAGVRVGGIALESDTDFFEDDVNPQLHRVSMDFMVTHDE